MHIEQYTQENSNINRINAVGLAAIYTKNALEDDEDEKKSVLCYG